MRIVSKFGGSSLADANQIRKVCDIIVSNTDRKLIVVSAPGKRFRDDIKVTDLLISLANTHLQGIDASYEFKAVINRFKSIAADLKLDDEIIDEISKDIFSKYNADSSNRGKYMDAIKASGEDNCAKIVAKYLNTIGYDAEYINPGSAGLVLSDEFGNASVLPESYDNLSRLNDNPSIKIFPGFFGYSIHGDIVTLPRGGSDVTGSILAAAVSADIYENFTDVDSVFSVNPNLVKNPAPINDLTYKEMRELSYAGFSVFHEEALTPVYYKGIPVHIKNTNNPEAKGTKIHKDITIEGRNPVTGIAGDKGFSSIYIRKYLMNREIGFTRKVLQILEEESIPYEHIPSGIDDISIILRKKFLTADTERKIVKRIKKLGTDEVYVTHNQALVMIVGEGCLDTTETFAKASRAFADNNILVKMVNQGSSTVSIMFGMDERYYEEAIVALYKAFYA
ncbi:MAG: aspartate kinase [Clostridia bacterium]|nr:aspartate kinase [Clostridia bacterium]